MTGPSLLTIESWVPEPVQNAGIRLRSELKVDGSEKGLEVLSRLLSDPRMELVWQELSKTKRDDKYKSTAEFVHSARVTNSSWALEHRRQARELRENSGVRNEEAAKLLEAEAAIEEALGDSPGDPKWSEQDRGLQLFLKQACLSAINIRPAFFSDLQAQAEKLRKVTATLREQVIVLELLEMKREVHKLRKIASRCEEEAEHWVPNLETDDPWVISRNRGDAELRTYVVSLSIPTITIFGTPLYGTLATVANVVFSRDTVTAEMVREWLR